MDSETCQGVAAAGDHIEEFGKSVLFIGGGGAGDDMTREAATE
jgi:hypothetical protein